MNERPRQPVIWVTRPAPGVGVLCDAIEAAGLAAVAVPTLEIVAPPDPAAAAEHARHTLPVARLAVFVSRNAVDWLWRLLGAETDSFLARTGVVAVGPATAAALRNKAIERVIIPAQGADSEALLALPEFSQTAMVGAKVAIVRGRGGREVLADVLRQRGARVSYIEVYVRQQCVATARRLPRLWQSRPPAAIVVSSRAGIEALVAMTPADTMPALLTTSLVCLGRQLSARAAMLGFSGCTTVPAAEGDRGIVQALKSQLARPAYDR